MFVTDSFTYVHLPKTGGTFVAATLSAIHAKRGDRVETIWIDPDRPAVLPAVTAGLVVRLMSTARYQHGRRSEIPPDYASRPVLATIRSPYDRYVSQYEFAWWRHEPEMFGPLSDVRARYPRYPELTFEEFVHLANDALVPYRGARHPDDTPGFHTQQFVNYFFRDPASALPLLWNGAKSPDGPARLELEGLHLIDQARLNEGLAQFLAGHGYAPDEVAFARHADRVLPPEGGREAGAHWEPYYSAELKAFVQEKERVLFEWFPQFVARG
jgi:hypothetical protein